MDVCLTQNLFPLIHDLHQIALVITLPLLSSLPLALANGLT